MNDTCGRKINYLRISITDRCNLRCKYCIPKKGVHLKSHDEILRIEEITAIVREAAQLGVSKVRLTGGEPLIRRGVTKLIRNIATIDGIQDLAMTTNGTLLSKYAEELSLSGLKRVNISINSLSERKYQEITRGGKLSDVLRGIEAAYKFKLTPVKLNVVLIKGFNDDEIEDFIKLTIDNDIDVRFIELMPIGEASSWSQEHFISNNIILQRFPVLLPLQSEDHGSAAVYYRMPGALGRIGLINPISNHFCNRCNRIRLTADGRLKPCLHSDHEVEVRNIIRNNRSSESIIKLLQKAIVAKPAEHMLNIDGFEPIVRNMYQIGG
jgi:cyclic pyranopterin phosphate synthase